MTFPCIHETLKGYGPHLGLEVSRVTKIPPGCLKSRANLFQTSIAQRMGWAAGRETTRIEDEAYCLLGVFGINMPLIYGEGSRAFLRLQEEIIKRSNDLSILAWSRPVFREWRRPVPFQRLPVLAASPAYFKSSRVDAERTHLFRKPYAMTNNGLEIRTTLSMIREQHLPGAMDGITSVYLLQLNYARERPGKRWCNIEIPLIFSQDRYHRIILDSKEETILKLPRQQLREQMVYLYTMDDLVDNV